jgi:hypothetical protein
MNSVSSVIKHCVDITTQVIQNPCGLIVDPENQSFIANVSILNDWSDARLTAIFYNNCGLGRQSPAIEAVNVQESPSELKGPTLWLYEKPDYDLKGLTTAYQKVMERVTKCWSFAGFRNEFVVYRKNTVTQTMDQVVKEEMHLIQYLAKNLSLKEDVIKVDCTQSEKNPFTAPEVDGDIYLYVKKSALEDVRTKFGFKLPEIPGVRTLQVKVLKQNPATVRLEEEKR